MQSLNPLTVAIRVRTTNDGVQPDHYCNGMGLGLYTSETANGFLMLSSIWDSTRPFALFVSYLLIGLLFFYFWLPTPQKQEYFFLALFALFSAAQQAQATNFLHQHQTSLTALQIWTVLSLWTIGTFRGRGKTHSKLRTRGLRLCRFEWLCTSRCN